LPLVTIGASTAALYYTTHNVIRYDRGRVWSSYWESFFGNFKQATPLWLLLVAVAYILGVNAYSTYMIYTAGNVSKWIFLVVLVPLALITMGAIYLFPLMARFQSTVRSLMKNSLLIAFRNIHWTILLMGMFVGSVYLVLVVPFAFVYIPEAYMFMSGWILEPIFQKYMTPEDLAKEQERNKSVVEDA
jgi:uncharacterized membrane protein YesL